MASSPILTKEALWQALKEERLPGFRAQPLLGAVSELAVDEAGQVAVALRVAHLNEAGQQAVVEAVRRALLGVAGVQGVTAQVVAVGERPGAEGGAAPVGRIHRLIAVGSGKGGVGKSTVAVNLALALAQQGQRVGLLDADIFGPNVPRMLGVAELPPKRGTLLVPAEAHGLKLLSVGLMVQPEQAVIWRGPMTDKVLRQFLHGAAWGELDTLVVDLPPGTGDIAISLARHAPPDGAIVVVTPQEVALDDARKAIGMFRRLEVPLLGIVENMSFFQCSGCGERHALFGEGGGARLAAESGLPLLAQLPFEPTIAPASDSGQPALLQQSSATAQALRALARHIAPPPAR